MTSQVGIWIDHRRAFLVYIFKNEIKTEEILSDVEKHVRPAGGSRSTTPYGPQDVVAEDHIDRKFMHHLEQYYDKVSGKLEAAESIFVFGPAEAKYEFKKHLEKSAKKPLPPITIDTTDKLTDAQIIAKVKDHYIKS